jgi:hypothetical protein
VGQLWTGDWWLPAEAAEQREECPKRPVAVKKGEKRPNQPGAAVVAEERLDVRRREIPRFE